MNKKLQVFVSSTYTDLLEERQAAVEAILDAGHIPAGMELFKAGNESQLKTIYKWIDESDVYMLILGGRYGSIEPKSSKSYTQLEYEYAINKNIPIFAVVLSESYLTEKIKSLGLSKIMEQKSPDKYQIFKSLVMSKIVRVVDDCKDIKISVHSSIHHFLDVYSLTGWTRNTVNEETVRLNLKIKNLVIENTVLKNKLNDLQTKIDKTIYQSTQIENKQLDNFLNKNIFLFIKEQLEKQTFLITLNPDENEQKTAIQNAFKIFMNNYNILKNGVVNSNYKWQTGLLYQHVCPVFLQYDLVTKKQNMNYGTIYQISKSGILFYKTASSQY